MDTLRKSLLTILIFGLLPIGSFAQKAITLPVKDYNPENLKQKDENGNLIWGLLKLRSDDLTKYSFTTDEKRNKVIKHIIFRKTNSDSSDMNNTQ